MYGMRFMTFGSVSLCLIFVAAEVHYLQAAPAPRRITLTGGDERHHSSFTNGWHENTDTHTDTQTHTHTHILTFVHLAPTYLCLSPQEWCCSGSPSAYPQALGDRGRKEEREGERERERHEEERKSKLEWMEVLVEVEKYSRWSGWREDKETQK